MAWEVLLEPASVDVEVLYHIVDVGDVALKLVFLTFDALVPNHGQKSFDIGLRHLCVLTHLQVGTSELSRQYICLALHQGVFLLEKVSPRHVRPEPCLDAQS